MFSFVYYTSHAWLLYLPLNHVLKYSEVKYFFFLNCTVIYYFAMKEFWFLWFLAGRQPAALSGQRWTCCSELYLCC